MNDIRQTVSSTLRYVAVVFGVLASAVACDLNSTGSENNQLPVATTRLNVGESTTCVATTGATVFCWGLNSAFREFGVGSDTTAGSSVPYLITATNVASMSSGHGSHACGMSALGSVKCWGRNTFGQVGGNLVATTGAGPVVVAGNANWSMISTGRLTTCGVTALMVAYCWGANQRGEGGNSTRGIGEAAIGPRQVEITLDFKSVAAGWTHSCGITTAGALYCWGDNNHGQLGIGAADTAVHRVPAAVQPTLQFTQVVAGGTYTCAIAVDKNAYCWGQNATGNLGDGTLTERAAPTLVSGGMKFVQISASTGFGTGNLTGLPNVPVGAVAHTCALTETGAAYCWGWNGAGQLGDGTIIDRLAPVAVSGGKTFTEIGAGAAHTCGMNASTVSCWGSNASGQLGNGNTTNSSVPLTVAKTFNTAN
ncbi:MAG: hypothetical protein ABI852_07215 [Gemmatimonadaceae bacterium]